MFRKLAKQVSASPDQQTRDTHDTSHSVHGDMAGGYRLDGFQSSDGTVENFDIPFGDKAIICQRYLAAVAQLKEGEVKHPSVLFTHGAGGGIANPATVQFAKGFSSLATVTCFQGTRNLQSRVKTFHRVIEHQKTHETVLGGRSMGARAATVTASDSTDVSCLILVSYPLTNDKGAVRDQILLDLDSQKCVLFIVGDQDKMCDLGRLDNVRAAMKARTWRLVVKGADHSMSLKPAGRVDAIRRQSGYMAAEWLRSRNHSKIEASISYDEKTGKVTASHWSTPEQSASRKRAVTESATRPSKRSKRS